MGLASRQEISRNSTIIHVTDAQVSQYAQIREGIQYLKSKQEGRSTSLSEYYLIDEQCSFSGNGGGACYPLIPFKISDIPKLADLFGIGKAQLASGVSLYLEYNADYYGIQLYQPDVHPIYSNSLLYGIAVSVVGSVAIWLVWARLEGSRK